MSRLLLRLMAILEFAGAALLAYLGQQLPGEEEIAASFQSADQVTSHASAQVEVLRSQVQDLRHSDLQSLIADLEKRSQAVATHLRGRSLDFGTLSKLREALKAIAHGLELVAQALHPDNDDMRKGLREAVQLLRSAQNQLNEAMDRQPEIESWKKETAALASQIAHTVPLVTRKLATRLREEEQTLNSLKQSLDEFRGPLPAYEAKTIRAVAAARWLCWLAALLVSLHGIYLLLKNPV